MFRLTVESVFSAAHAIVINGAREPLHGHDWHVQVALEGPALDADGLLCDFHAVQAHLERVIAPFRNANLNDVPPFRALSGGSGTNPTAEEVARHIGHEVSALYQTTLAREPKKQGMFEGVVPSRPHTQPRVAWVRVTEAVGCAATYFLSDQP